MIEETRGVFSAAVIRLKSYTEHAQRYQDCKQRIDDLLCYEFIVLDFTNIIRERREDSHT